MAAALLLTSFRRELLMLPDDELGHWAAAVRSQPAVRWLRERLAAAEGGGPRSPVQWCGLLEGPGVAPEAEPLVSASSSRLTRARSQAARIRSVQ